MVRTGRVELPWPCGRWNLNPVRLPVPPRSRAQDCSHYNRSHLAGIGRDATLELGALRHTDARRLTSARASRRVDGLAAERKLRRLNVQPLVGLTLGRQELARWTDNLLENRQPKILPQALPIIFSQPGTAGAAEDDQRVCQRRNLIVFQRADLLKRPGHGRGRERRRLLIPSIRKNPDRAGQPTRRPEPWNQHRGARGRRDRIYKSAE